MVVILTYGTKNMFLMVLDGICHADFGTIDHHGSDKSFITPNV